MVEIGPLEYSSGPLFGSLLLLAAELMSGIGTVELLDVGVNCVLSSESESTAIG